jgi:hypothetical protein
LRHSRRSTPWRHRLHTQPHAGGAAGLLLELKDRFRRSAAGLLHELKLDYAGRELIPLIGTGDERNNYEVLIRLMQRTLNSRLEPPNHEGRRTGSAMTFAPPCA